MLMTSLCFIDMRLPAAIFLCVLHMLNALMLSTPCLRCSRRITGVILHLRRRSLIAIVFAMPGVQRPLLNHRKDEERRRDNRKRYRELRIPIPPVGILLLPIRQSRAPDQYQHARQHAERADHQ